MKKMMKMMKGNPMMNRTATMRLVLSQVKLRILSTVQAPTATTLRNFIIKRWGGRAVKSVAFNTAWDNFQKLSLTLNSIRSIPNVVKAFEDHGWTRLKHLQPGVIGLSYKNGSDWAELVIMPDGWITCTGPKKAKSSSLPLYD